MMRTTLLLTATLLSALTTFGADATRLWNICGSFGRFTGPAEKTEGGFVAKSGGIRVETKIVRDASGVESRATTLRNASGSAVSACCLSDRFVFDGGEWQVYTQVNGWQHESQGAWQPLHSGVIVRSDGLRSCEGAAPMMALWNEAAGKGRVFHLRSNARWAISAVRETAGGENFEIAVEAGFDSRALDYRLSPGESVTFPEILTYEFTNKADLDCHLLHAYWNARCPSKGLPAIYNSWLCRFDKLDYDFVLKQVDRAKEIGFDYFVIDAGWFGPAKDWSSVRGDWEERPDGYLKGRLAGISKAVRDRGMKFGFWLECESAMAGTRVYREHPEWFVKLGGAIFLDFRNPAAFTNMLDTVSGLVAKYGASFLKFDFNQTAAYDPTGRAFADYNAAYRRFARAVKHRHPDLYLEGCASGGQMMDLTWADVFDSFWPTDNQSAFHSFRIAKETMLRLPPRYLERWLTISRADGIQPDYGGHDARLVSTDDATWSRLRSLTMPFADAFTLGGPFAMSCDLTALSPADVAHFRDLVAERRREGAFWSNAVGRIVADTPSVTALQYSDAALSDIRLVIVPHRPTTREAIVRPAVDPAADPAADYLVRGAKRTGSDLVRNGLSFAIGRDEPQIVRLVKLQPNPTPTKKETR